MADPLSAHSDDHPSPDQPDAVTSDLPPPVHTPPVMELLDAGLITFCGIDAEGHPLFELTDDGASVLSDLA